ncbi:Geraniol 8-hydroxylase [Linum perenne]
MDYEISGISLLLLLWVVWAITTERRHRRFEQLGRLPPGPRPLPIVGNIFNLGWAPHVSFVQLAQAHGPIMTLYLGSMCTVVISSKEAARTMFKSYDMFTAGTDTTTSTLEWAMAELLHNPEKLHKVQEAVINETLRLHPPLPFLVPHMAMQPCKMLGYYIPKETQILVNVWGIGRDPATWPDPLTFKPERFLDPDALDHKGQHFEFLPFGSGRRMCPALPLASRVLPLALGSLLHEFVWCLPDGLKVQNMDMSERMGITLRKAVPLKVIPIRRRYCN